MRVILEKVYGEALLVGLEEITAACAFANTLYIMGTLCAALQGGHISTMDQR
jgi:hypothetical protein